jgi:hypothetical protein
MMPLILSGQPHQVVAASSQSRHAVARMFSSRDRPNSVPELRVVGEVEGLVDAQPVGLALRIARRDAGELAGLSCRPASPLL